ncbi:MAG TPA: SHOCT domain-containing protein [Thermomicrobiaceae bacterium]|nr:SHOCT domain-containing protein [Thermomicrobiaceae bacterium]
MTQLYSQMTLLATPAHGWGHGGGPWFWWPLIPLVWVALIGGVVWFAARRPHLGQATGTGANVTGQAPAQSARQILAERYARGEISTEEYQERLTNLLD